MTKAEIREKLFSLQDKKYKEFEAKLIPNIDPDSIIGIKTPVVRALAKELFNDPKIGEFLEDLPHKYVEENALHSFIIGEIKDFEGCIKALNKFLPFVDNWATCDSIRPKCFKKNTDKLITQIKLWLDSEHTYTVRFGIEMLMVYFLDEKFDVKYPETVAKVKSDEYYVNMMIAWYFATALSKQYNRILPLLKQNKLPAWVHNKTIQKAVESYRITAEQKQYLRTLRIK